MPTITLKRADAVKLLTFCRLHNSKQFFVAKDQGAYVGQSAGAKGNCIFYFKGCDPKLNPEDYYDNARDGFGGDDFGEHLPIAWLEKFDRPEVLSMTIRVNKGSISAKFMVAKT